MGGNVVDLVRCLLDVPEPWIADLGPGVADGFLGVDDMFQGGSDTAETGGRVRSGIGVPELGDQGAQVLLDGRQIWSALGDRTLPQSHGGGAALADRGVLVPRPGPQCIADPV